jgi:hypothetical protein
MNTEKMRKLIKDRDIQDISHFISVCDHVDYITGQMNEFKKDKQKLIDDHKIAMHYIETKINVTRNSCQHVLTTFYADPSGGSDSYTECDICGKEL